MPRLPRPTATPAVALLAAALVALSLIVGCSDADNGTDSADPAPPAAGQSEPAGTDATAGPSGSGGAAFAEPTQTTRVRVPEGRVEIGLVELRADGRLATLNLLFTPHLTGDPPGLISLYEMVGDKAAAVTLVDSENLRRYTVVKDSGGQELGADSATTRTRNDTTVPATYTFAAPPAEVTAIDVYLNDQLIFDDAPIAR